MNTTRVRFDCRLGEGDTALYADLPTDELAGIVQLLLDYRNGGRPLTSLIKVIAARDPDYEGSQWEFMAWRVARVVACQDDGEALLYERLRPERVADDEQPDGLIVPLTRAQAQHVLAGGVVRVDFPADEVHGPPITVIVRLKREPTTTTPNPPKGR